MARLGRRQPFRPKLAPPVVGPYVPPAAGAARTFNGTSDKVTVGAAPSINNLTTFSVYAWVRHDGTLNSAADAYILSKNGTDRAFRFGDLNGGSKNIALTVGRAATATTYYSPTNTVAANTWTFVAATFDNSAGTGLRVKLYACTNPYVLAALTVAVGTEGSGAINDDSAGALVLGGRSADDLRDLRGDMARVGYVGRVLTLAELQAAMVGTAPTGVAGAWALTEPGTPTTAADSSLNSNTGIYSGTTETATAIPSAWANTGLDSQIGWHSDSFTRADSTGLGTDWSVTSFNISSNAAVPSSTGAVARWQRDFGKVALGPDYRVQARLTAPTTTGRSAGVMARHCTDTTHDNYYGVRVVRQTTNDTVEIIKCVAGVTTVLGSVFTLSGHWTDTNYLRIEVSGDTVTAKSSSDGVSFMTIGSVSDSTWSEVNGSYGLFASHAEGSFTDFSADFLPGKDALYHWTIGAVTATSVRLGFCTSPLLPGGNTVLAEVSTDPTFVSGVLSASTTSLPDANYCGHVTVIGLTASTAYRVRLTVNGTVKTLNLGTFTTPPVALTPAAFTFAFGSCHMVSTDLVSDDLTFGALTAKNPAFALDVGDLTYQDSADPPAATANLSQMRAKAVTAMSSATHSKRWAASRRSLPWYTMWDDHDTGRDDFSAGTSDSFYAPSRQAFLENAGQANPDPYNSGFTGSFYYSFSYGDCGFFVLDHRSYRSSNNNTDNSSKTILGTTQLVDLKAWLLANKTTYKFKFVVCPTSVNGLCSTGGDSWGGAADGSQSPTSNNGFRTERNALWTYITSNSIPGVVWLEGDQHWSQAVRAIDPDGFPHYCFQASPFNKGLLAPPATTSTEVLWRYSATMNFGVVSVDTTVSPATLTFAVYDGNGSAVTGQHPAGSPSTTPATTTITENDINSGLSPPSTVAPTIFLTASVARFVDLAGGAQPAISLSGNTQRVVDLTGDAGSNS